MILTWDFGIRSVEAWTSLPAVDLLGLDQRLASRSSIRGASEQPWVEIELLVHADDDRTYNLAIERLADFLQPHHLATLALHERRLDPLLGLRAPSELFVAPWATPRVLTAAEHVDEALVDLLLYSSPTIRSRVLQPLLTGREESVLGELDVATEWTDFGLRELDEPF